MSESRSDDHYGRILEPKPEAKLGDGRPARALPAKASLPVGTRGVAAGVRCLRPSVSSTSSPISAEQLTSGLFVFGIRRGRRPPRRMPSVRPIIAERGKLEPMTAAVKAVLEQARRLTAEEREELAEALLAELDGEGDDAELEDGWDAEIARRDALVESGEMPLHDAESVMAEADALLRPRSR